MSLKIGRNDPCWCGSGKKYKKCHEAFDEKMEIMKQKGYAVIDHDLIKTPEQIAKIKESCKINIAVLDYVEEPHPGIRFRITLRLIQYLNPGFICHQIFTHP